MSQNIHLAPGSRVVYLDDEQENLDAFEYALFDHFDVRTFARARDALDFLGEDREVAVVVSDIKMPEMDGFEFLHQVERVNPLPVKLLLTGYNDERLAIKALNGQLCQGYFKKIEAFSGERLREIVDEASRRYASSLQDRILTANTSLILKRLLAYKDRTFTHEHVHNVELLCRLMMPNLDLTEIDRQLLPMAAVFHDVGKLVVRDQIVSCTRGLTFDEYTEMKQHATYGAELLKGVRGFERCLDAALDHHECYDGSGYPHGKRGEEISLFGRIVAVADFFDALASERVYKDAVPVDRVLGMLDDDAGKRFDPQVVTVFQQSWRDAPELVRHYEKQNERLRLLKPSLAARSLPAETLESVELPRQHLDQVLRSLRSVSELMNDDPVAGPRIKQIWTLHSTDYFLQRAADVLRKDAAPAAAAAVSDAVARSSADGDEREAA